MQSVVTLERPFRQRCRGLVPVPYLLYLHFGLIQELGAGRAIRPTSWIMHVGPTAFLWWFVFDAFVNRVELSQAGVTSVRLFYRRFVPWTAIKTVTVEQNVESLFFAVRRWLFSAAGYINWEAPKLVRFNGARLCCGR